MNKYVVTFSIPAAAIQEWVANVSEEERGKQTAEMMRSWQQWRDAHKDSIVEEGWPLGKTKRVTKEGVTDIKNDLNWVMIVQADSHDAAAQLFVNHPHIVNIPSAYVEVMDSNRPGM